MSNRQLWKSVIPFMEVGEDGSALVADSSKQYGLDNKVLRELVGQQQYVTATTGTSTAYLADTNPAYTARPSLAPLPGTSVSVKFHTTNGSTPTFKYGTSNALPMLVNGVAPSGASVVTTKIYVGVTDGVSWDFR